MRIVEPKHGALKHRNGMKNCVVSVGAQIEKKGLFLCHCQVKVHMILVGNKFKAVYGFPDNWKNEGFSIKHKTLCTPKRNRKGMVCLMRVLTGK